MQENTIITILNPSNVFLKVKTILLFEFLFLCLNLKWINLNIQPLQKKIITITTNTIFMFLINKKFENSLHIKSLTGELTIKEICKIILIIINNVNLGHPWHKPYIWWWFKQPWRHNLL